MLNKSEMSLKKLSLLLIALSLIWLLCWQEEKKFPKAFQDQLITRMGGKPFDPIKLKMAQKLKKNASVSQAKAIKDQIQSRLIKQYELQFSQEGKSDPKKQQHICVAIRDFDLSQEHENYYAVKSIITQNYSNYHLFYVSTKNDPSSINIQSYLISNQVPNSKYTFVNAFVDTNDVLFKVSQKCPKQAIVLLLEKDEVLSNSLVFQLINRHIKEKVQLTWANSLYSNDQPGFSFDVSNQIRIKNRWRKFPLPMNDVIAFKNQLFIRNRNLFYHDQSYYPLLMAESFGFTFLEKASQYKYIPEILSFKNRPIVYRSDRAPLKKQLQKIIRQKKSIINLLKNHTQMKKS